MSTTCGISVTGKVFSVKKSCLTFALSIEATAIVRPTADARQALRPVSVDANDLGLVYTAGRSDREP